MEKIRIECFETNSSSVHSLTTKSKTSKVELATLNKDGVLYPDVFYNTIEHFTGDYDGYHIYNDGCRWLAYNRDEKAALLFLYLNYGLLDVEQDDFDQFKVKACIEYAKSKLDYKDIILGKEAISPFTENGEVEFELAGMSKWSSTTIEKLQNTIDKFIEAINDKNLYIEVMQGEG